MPAMPQAPSYESRFQNQSNAQDYRDRFERPTHRHINRREQRALSKILCQLEPSQLKSILDMPSGAGRFLPTLLHPGRTIIEIDVSHEMLQLSSERISGQSNGANLYWLQGDAFKLPLADASIDCIFCNRLLHHFRTTEQRLKILRELHRVSRRYVIVSFFDYHRFGKLRMLLKKLRGRNPDYSGHPTKPAFDAEVVQGGFKTVSITPTGPLWVAQVYYLLEKSA